MLRRESIDASVEALRKNETRTEELTIRDVVVAMISVRVAGVVARRVREMMATSRRREQDGG